MRFSLLEGDEQAAHWPATAGPFRPLTSVQLRTRCEGDLGLADALLSLLCCLLCPCARAMGKVTFRGQRPARQAQRAVTNQSLPRCRHWLIRDARGNLESEVRGEAVVGHYPLLTPGTLCRRRWPASHTAKASCTWAGLNLLL